MAVGLLYLYIPIMPLVLYHTDTILIQGVRSSLSSPDFGSLPLLLLYVFQKVHITLLFESSAWGYFPCFISVSSPFFGALALLLLYIFPKVHITYAAAWVRYMGSFSLRSAVCWVRWLRREAKMMWRLKHSLPPRQAQAPITNCTGQREEENEGRWPDRTRKTQKQRPCIARSKHHLGERPHIK